MMHRVFSLRVMRGVFVLSLGFWSRDDLPFNVQRPLIEPGGGLAGSIGTLIVVEAERGMALINIVVGATLIALAVASFIVRPVWRFENALPE